MDRYLVSEPGLNQLYYLQERSVKPELKDDFEKFRELKEELSGRGQFEAETPFLAPFNRSNCHHIYGHGFKQKKQWLCS